MNVAKISKKLWIKWNFELTVFELIVPNLYICLNCLGNILGVFVKCEFLNELIKIFNVIYFLSI